MTSFFFVRHGQMDTSYAGQLFFNDFAYNMLTLSEKGIQQIHNTAKDERLRNADLIITSSFGRALHSAAILSKELGVEIKVEPELHEWLPDIVSYKWQSQEAAERAYHALCENGGYHPAGEECTWESADMMKARVFRVLEKYRHLDKVIVVCHGMLMQFVLGIDHPENGEIAEYRL